MIPALQELHAFSSDFPTPQSEWYWRFRSLEAEILMLQGLPKEGLALLDGKLPESLANSDVAAWRNMTEAAANAALAHFELARINLANAEVIIREYQPQLLGDFTLRKGSLALLEGNLREAEMEYRETLDLAKNSHDLFLEAAARGSMGLIATKLERYDESIDWNTRALELSRSVNAVNSIARIEGNIGWSYHEMGDLVSALEQFQLAEKNAQKAGLVADRAYWLNSVAGVFYDLRDFAAAESAAQTALSLARDLNDSGAIVECLQTLALVSIEKNENSRAKDAVEEAIHLEPIAPDLDRDFYTRLISARASFSRKELDQAKALYIELASNKQVPTSIRWQAQAGLAQIYASQGKNALAEQKFLQAISTISNAWSELEHEEFRLSFLSSAIRFYDLYINFLISHNRQLDALKIADRSRAQTLEHGLSLSSAAKIPRKSAVPAPFHPQDTARSWNATLLFYWLGADRSSLWVVTPSKVSLVTLPASPEIDALAKSYRKSFLDPVDPLEAGNVYGKKLYELLIRPAEKLIPKNSQVIILPDGSLNGLNFETLIVSDSKPHYWIEEVTVSIANSLSLLSRARPTSPPKNTNLLFFGDALQASKDFPSLPDSGRELASLEKYFPESRRTIFTGARAMASNYLSSNPGEYSYIHFSTHGIASTPHPLESAIILSPEGDSFKLYARNIIQRPLNAYLVSISACNAAGDRVFVGEGLVGLSWAFLRAGAHNVVASLWEVSNASSPQLMDDLYKGIFDGQDPATALRNAKLSLVHSKGPFHRPFYWAPFQLYSGS